MRVYNHIFAAMYDRFMAASEKAGMRDKRRSLLEAASGTVMEIGAGTGVNIPLYGDRVEKLVLTEAEEPMLKRLKDRATGTSLPVEAVLAEAEALPLPDASVDTVVSTLVLCTVEDMERSLSEIARVLKPGGKFLFLEHVRSEDERVARWQDRLHGPWKVFGNGCHCNRPTLREIERSELKLQSVEHGEVPKAPPIVRPLISGAAER